MAEGAVEYAKELGWEHPQIVLHLDHGDSFELCKSCVDFGFSSVMIDGSHLPYEENVALTKKVVEYAHQFDVTVEASSAYWQALKTKFLLTTTHTPTLKRLSISQHALAAILWLSQSVHHTELTSSLRSSATSTHRLAAWFLLHWGVPGAYDPRPSSNHPSRNCSCSRQPRQRRLPSGLLGLGGSENLGITLSMSSLTSSERPFSTVWTSCCLACISCI